MSTVHVAAHAEARWQQRGPRTIGLGSAFRAARYLGPAKLRTHRALRARREMCYGYAYDRWVFVVAYRPACVVLTIWPRPWWDREAAAYAHWWAQTYHQQEEDPA